MMDLLADDEPLAGAPANPQASVESPAPVEEEQAESQQLRFIEVLFEQPGSLGIEFERLAAPYVVEQVHATGLAYGRGLEPGDRVQTAGGKAVDDVPWDDFVELLMQRPVLVTFVRDPSRQQTKGVLAGFAGAAGGLAGAAGGFAGRLGDLSGKVTSSAQQGLGGFGGSLGGLTSSSLGGLTSTAQQGLGGLTASAKDGFGSIGGSLGGLSGSLGGLGGKATQGLGSLGGLGGNLTSSWFGGSQAKEEATDEKVVEDFFGESEGVSTEAANTESSNGVVQSTAEEPASLGDAAASQTKSKEEDPVNEVFDKQTAASAAAPDEKVVEFFIGGSDGVRTEVASSESGNEAMQSTAAAPTSLGASPAKGKEDDPFDEAFSEAFGEQTAATQSGPSDPLIQQEALKKLEAEHQQKTAEAEQRRQQVMQLNSELESLRAGHQSQLEKLKSELQAKDASIQSFEGQAIVARDEAQRLSGDLESRIAEVGRLEAQLQEAKEACERVGQQAQAEAAKSSEQEAQKRHEEAHEQKVKEAEERAQQVLQLQTEIANLRAGHESQLENLKSELQAKDAAIQSFEGQANLSRDEEARKSLEAEHEQSVAEAKERAQQVLQLQAELENLRAGHQSQVENLQAELQAKDAAIQSFEGQANTSRDQANQLSGELENRVAEIRRLESQLQEAKVVCERAGEQAQAEEARKRLQQAHEQKAAEAQERTQQVMQLQLELDNLRAGHQSQLENLKSDLQAKDAVIQNFEGQASTARDEAQRLSGELEGRTVEIGRLENQLQEAKVACERIGQQAQAAVAQKEEHVRELLRQKEEQVKDLLRQLAAAGPVDQSSPQPPEETETEAAATFDVMFALSGSLGVEFRQTAAPFVVARIHDTGVAAGLGIEGGDELISVAGTDVTSATWDELVQRLSTRPVIAKFRRNPFQENDEQGRAGLLTSVTSSVGKGLLNVANKVVAAKAGENGTTSTDFQGTQDSRLQAEVERLGTLLKARDQEVVELLNKLVQKDEALAALQVGDSSVADTAQLIQERTALAQQVDQLRSRAEEADSQADQLVRERQQAMTRLEEEKQEKEQYRQQVTALTEQCNSLMKQFETLSQTCQGLSLDAQQKASLEGQVQELMRVNAHWQQAHQSLSTESESLRSQTEELAQLRAEVTQLRKYETACIKLEERLRQLEAQLEAAGEASMRVQAERVGDYETIQRLQSMLESVQESGGSETFQLETELMERSRECTTLRREAEEYRRKAEELLQRQHEMREAAEESHSFKAQVSGLQRDIASRDEEINKLTAVVNRCVEKMEKDSRERPHLVDKRMVTQMVAAYLEQRDHPRQAQEIMEKMANLLGFTTAEREQVGLARQRRSLVHQGDENVSLADQLMDFLLEESEA